VEEAARGRGRRIRDELRRDEGLKVSAEEVRQAVNEAVIGHSPPEPARGTGHDLESLSALVTREITLSPASRPWVA